MTIVSVYLYFEFFVAVGEQCENRWPSLETKSPPAAVVSPALFHITTESWVTVLLIPNILTGVTG